MIEIASEFPGVKPVDLNSEDFLFNSDVHVVCNSAFVMSVDSLTI